MAHLVRDEGVAGSNPATPTTLSMTCTDRPAARAMKCATKSPRRRWTNGGRGGKHAFRSSGYQNLPGPASCLFSQSIP